MKRDKKDVFVIKWIRFPVHRDKNLLFGKFASINVVLLRQNGLPVFLFN